MAAREIAKIISQLAREDEKKVEAAEGLLASSKDQDFGAIFGRDSAIRIIFRLATGNSRTDFSKIRQTLITLSKYQGQTIDPYRDEEPGKIPHELRFDNQPKNQQRLTELKLANWPVEELDGHYSMRYYGSADATPLFIVASCWYLAACKDANEYELFVPHIKQAIDWMINFGDCDNDLFIEFKAANRNALLNQGWKDSANSIQTIKGERPKEPIALVEIQGYQYWALREAAKLFANNNDKASSDLANERARQLKEKFNRDFWMADKNFFAYALDGDKKQIKDITSNVGHLLVSEIIEDNKLPTVVNRLLRPDLLTPYGIRTLSSDSSYYSEEAPLSYHNGTVWPHDNAIIVLGLEKLGFKKEAQMIKEAVVKAQIILKEEYQLQNVELYSVDKQNRLSPYKYAQKPQGWVVDANKEIFSKP